MTHLIKFFFIVMTLLTKTALSAMDFNFNQNKYDILIERVDAGEHSVDFIDFYEVKSFKTRSDGILFNVTVNLVQEIPSFKLTAEALQFFSNQYRKTNIKLNGDGCKVVEKAGVIQAAKTTNGNLTNCPMSGRYHVYDYKPDAHYLPPLIPEGQYKLNLIFQTMKNEFVFQLDLYAKLFYAVKKH